MEVGGREVLVTAQGKREREASEDMVESDEKGREKDAEMLALIRMRYLTKV